MPAASSAFPDRMSAAEYRRLVNAAPISTDGCSVARVTPEGLRSLLAEDRRRRGRSKHRNQPVLFEGERFDSGKELRVYKQLRALCKSADFATQVVSIRRQVAFEVIPAMQGERRAAYIADFVVITAAGLTRVIDVKSSVTRRLPAYVLKRELMLQVYGIRIEER